MYTWRSHDKICNEEKQMLFLSLESKMTNKIKTIDVWTKKKKKNENRLAKLV